MQTSTSPADPPDYAARTGRTAELVAPAAILSRAREDAPLRQENNAQTIELAVQTLV